MEKRQFTPKTVILNLEKDLGLEADINVEFWEDPSQEVCLTLIEIIGTSTEEEVPAEENIDWDYKYYKSASLMFVDCDIEGIDFSSIESTREAFSAGFLPWGIFHRALIAYVSRLLKEYEVLKNVIGRARGLSSSGTDNESKESQ